MVLIVCYIAGCKPTELMKHHHYLSSKWRRRSKGCIKSIQSGLIIFNKQSKHGFIWFLFDIPFWSYPAFDNFILKFNNAHIGYRDQVFKNQDYQCFTQKFRPEETKIFVNFWQWVQIKLKRAMFSFSVIYLIFSLNNFSS